MCKYFNSNLYYIKFEILIINKLGNMIKILIKINIKIYILTYQESHYFIIISATKKDNISPRNKHIIEDALKIQILLTNQRLNYLIIPLCQKSSNNCNHEQKAEMSIFSKSILKVFSTNPLSKIKLANTRMSKTEPKT